ncbi:MAG: type II toxin-antitoxin system HipA family toxin [Pseudonocardiaceae bacterium]
MSSESALVIQLQSSSGDWVDVGLLRNRDEHNWFEFADSYWERADRPVLGQIFEEHGRTWKPNSNVALPRWFSHLLPEGRLRSAVALAAAVSSKREFELLRRLGSTDLPGAARAIPAVLEDRTYRVPSQASEKEKEEAGVEDPLLKFSLAGAQLKFSVYGDGRGLTVPATGQAGNVILKLPDGRPGFEGVPEAELGALELARAAGIEVPRAWLVDLVDVAGLEDWATAVKGKALAIERFDRREGDLRVHMEELAQVLNIPTASERAKYTRANFEAVAIFVGELTGMHRVADVIDRIVLNVLVGNGDAHLKNWAFLYPDGKRPDLSPLYDVLPTVLFIAEDDLGMNLRKSKRFEAVTLESFQAIGLRAKFGPDDTRRQVLSAVERILSNWSTLSEFLSVEKFSVLNKRLNILPIVQQR